MTVDALNTLHTQVLWCSFGLAAVLGAIARQTHFCTMGAIADIVHMGDWTRLRMWTLAIGVAILGFNAMTALGWVDPAKSLYGGPRVMVMSAVTGGLLFGAGMVLASGCGNKTLVRIGGGNLKSLVVFIVMGVAAFATLKGVTAVARVESVDRVGWLLTTGQDLPSLLSATFGGTRRAWAAWAGGAVGAAVVGWSLRRPEGRSAGNWLGGVGVGAVVVAVWWVSGVMGHVDEHPLTLEETFLATNSQRMESLSFVAPVAYTLDWLMFFSDKSKLLTIGIATVLGVVTGAAAHAIATRSFRWEGFRDVQDTANHLVGATLMGVGGVTALGCTFGQGISGVSTLGLTSGIALTAIVAGAVAALRVQAWRLELAA